MKTCAIFLSAVILACLFAAAQTKWTGNSLLRDVFCKGKLTLIFALMAFLCLPVSSQTKHIAKKPSASPLNEQRCQQEIHADRPLISFYSGSPQVQDLVEIFSDGKLDVYTDDYLMKELVGSSVSGDFFSMHLYFVFRNEDTRQQAIQLIRQHPPLEFSNGCGDIFKSKSVVGKLDWMKYVVMDVTYARNGYTVRPTGYDPKVCPGPCALIGSSTYIAPLTCTDIKYNVYMEQSFLDKEVIWHNGIDACAPANIGKERLDIHTTDSCVTCTRWSLFAGAPMELLPGYFAVQLNTPQTDFLLKVLESARQKIKEGRNTIP
jgi:hypothetical protein